MQENEQARTETADDTRRQAPLTTRIRPTPPMACPECGTATAPDQRFCPSCHTWVRDRWVGRLASAKRRLAAAALDGSARDGGIFGAAVWTLFVPEGAATILVRVAAGLYGLASLYLWTKGTTPAKRLLGMTVIREDGEPADFLRMLFRETIGKWISMAALGLGFLTIPGDPEKRGWHDKMAGTWVIRDVED